jgi:hypothetical protein
MEIGLPNEQGRFQILSIHTSRMKEYKKINPDVDIKVRQIISCCLSESSIYFCILILVTHVLHMWSSVPHICLYVSSAQKYFLCGSFLCCQCLDLNSCYKILGFRFVLLPCIERYNHCCVHFGEC